MPNAVRVFLVSASPLTLKTLERMLAGTPDVEVVGTAKNGREALALLTITRPHVLCTDDVMPVMNGLELTQEVMRAHPCPVLVLSATPDAETRRAVLEAGALELMTRPSVVGLPDNAAAQQFVAHVKMLARVPVIGRRPSGQVVTEQPVSSRTAPLQSAVPSAASEDRARDAGIVAIGASTGGPQALMTILSALPAHYPYPVVCVQHVSRGFLEGLVTWLDEACRVRVAVAQAGEIVRGGTVLFPPEDRHLEIGMGGRVRLSEAAPRDGHRPSATVLFESVAASYGARALAVLLTGMGTDGASGLAAVHAAGGDTIAQDEESCVVFGMPRVAIERGAARHVCAPDEITRRLLSLGAEKRSV